MSEDTPTVDKPPKHRRDEACRSNPRCRQGELNRLTDDIVSAMKTVYDPEIPADIYELGLIYKIDIGDDRAVKIDMPLTTPNCPSAAGTADHGGKRRFQRAGREGNQGLRGVGSAVGSEPDVRRGPTRAQYVVSRGCCSRARRDS